MNPIQLLGKMIFGTLGAILNGVGQAIAGGGKVARDLAHLAVDEKNRAFVELKLAEADRLLEDLVKQAALYSVLIKEAGVPLEKQQKAIRELRRIRKQIAKVTAEIDRARAWLEMLENILHTVDPHEDEVVE